MNIFESQQEKSGPIVQDRFYPYSNNGGTSIAITGRDFAVVASDTRLSEGFGIFSRETPKLFKLTDSIVLASTGCWCDVLTFVKYLQTRIKLYYYNHRKSMDTQAVAQLVSNMLYTKRFFPYYVSNMVVGLDENGIGAIYGYDPVGSFDRVDYLATGSSSALIQPFLDNQIGLKNQKNPQRRDLPVDEVTKVVKDTFTSAAERDIYCGDSVLIMILTKDGIREERMPLRKD